MVSVTAQHGTARQRLGEDGKYCATVSDVQVWVLSVKEMGTPLLGQLGAVLCAAALEA